MNILLPMAGAGSRFAQVGYTDPKPFIDVLGQPMIKVVVDSLKMPNENYIFIGREEHISYFDKYRSLFPEKSTFLYIKGLTEGACCTTLLAERYIDNDQPLFIINSDQYIDWNPKECFAKFTKEGMSGGILTFYNQHPKWSYAAIDGDGIVTKVAEKVVISNYATIGGYVWNKGSDYVRYSKQMIAKNIRVNNEFYVTPVYNEAIEDGKKFTIYDVPTMVGMGTPEDLEVYLKWREQGSPK